ncbi:MAG: bifunctional diaminohydroxyphosphoribosylaminopyrimidine deaminase/5-amino-6-(5-phosphoribosylamino)uracil reductase RibD [Hyphomicrobiales bacterium]|nr:bifunctional diaminohydroxyphosphoribosylaminopyrimidine deaminase/5-amino-6-(5-phosphoribosylamino)uracil reductase RibD [Hyphomicrobiales bacterium]
MARALEFGRRGLGASAPNPSVGALVVRDDVIVGRGVTAPGGRPHGETQALQNAGAAARGATLYVTLEPCSHHGHTAPCVDAIIAAGVSRVVCAMQDPDPRVAGNGFARLRAAGILVDVGIMGAAARRAHLGHILRVTQARPMVTLKLAQTQDGFAGISNERLHVTGKIANDFTQMQRAQHDAVMVGIGTVLADDPMLNVRLPGMAARRPVRVVLDTHLRLPLHSHLADTAADIPSLLICGGQANASAGEALKAKGFELLRAKTDEAGGIDLDFAMQGLARRGISRVLCEGGPLLATNLLAASLVDQCLMLTGPAKLNAKDGILALAPQARQRLEREFTKLRTLQFGDDRCDFYVRQGS